jgi:hypothetical protein
MMRIDKSLQAVELKNRLELFWDLSAKKITNLETSTEISGAPVVTVDGLYTIRPWTDWTQGFQFGSAILQFDATGETDFLKLGRQNSLEKMSVHLTHTGGHDHGFQTVSTFGNLLRLMSEGRIPENIWERRYYELALKCSAAVQGHRWTTVKDGGGYIHSFNGPHSLFSDTIRTLRVLAIGHRLGHCLKGEGDVSINLLQRAIDHGLVTARYNVYYGEGRDYYDIRGRVAHESIFNIKDGSYRCPSTQQGYSPFTTWTRGLSWILCGFAEQLEFLRFLKDAEGDKLTEAINIFEKAAEATCDYYIDSTPSDGIPYWDTGAPGMANIDLNEPADPFNPWEPVDSSAAAIAAQGLLRMGRTCTDPPKARRYWQAGLGIAKTLLSDQYVSLKSDHQGLILHSLYHRPKGWDRTDTDGVARGESTMWGDYHARELCLYLTRVLSDETYPAFWNVLAS